MQISGSNFVVTGGGSGLGLATAKNLVRLGAGVVIADLNEEAGHAAKAELGASARFVRADVSQEADCAAVVETAVKEFGSLHGAINCAGISLARKVLGRDGVHSLEIFEKVIRINLIGTFNVLRLAAAQLQKETPNDENERGVIINTASAAAYDGQIGQASYSASKAGIVGMTLPIARELARFGIRVVTIAPGLFETPLLASLPKEATDALGKSVPFPSRLGRPHEFAMLVTQIIENPMLNGETIRLDGALRMAPQ